MHGLSQTCQQAGGRHLAHHLSGLPQPVTSYAMIFKACCDEPKQRSEQFDQLICRADQAEQLSFLYYKVG
jgi:hypothetical protein